MVVALIVFCVIASVAILLSVAVYNSVVRKDAHADVVEEHIRSLTLKQSERVSRLVSSVRAYGSADDRTITKVEHRLREVGASADTTAKLDASEALMKATSELIEEMSGCDEAMSSASFVELVAEIKTGQEEIEASQTDFVNCVNAYNDALAAFPASVICGPKFRPRKPVSTRDTADTVDATVATDCPAAMDDAQAEEETTDTV